MTDETTIALEQLIKTAESGKHRQKELICSWAGYTTARSFKSGLIKIIKGLERAERNSFNKYLETLKQISPDINFLTGSVAFHRVASFYKEELAIIKYEIKEYQTYLDYGHFIKSFLLGEVRALDDRIDYLELLSEQNKERDN